jgi:transposase
VTTYSEGFKRKMVQQLSMPGARSANVVSAEIGVGQTTLSRWVREARKMGGVDSRMKATNGGQEEPMKRRPEEWSFDEKVQVVIEATGLKGEALGALLRRKGLHESQVVQWREAMKEALEGSTKPSRKQSAAGARRIRQLERELRRKEKALAEAAALLVLQKKVQALWGEEDGDTKGSNER